MSDGCKTILEWGKGEKIDCVFTEPCHTVTLRSIDDKKVGVFPTRNYYFKTDDDGVYSHLYCHDLTTGKRSFIGKDLLLKVERDTQGQLKLALYDQNGNKVNDLETNNIRKIGSINLEQYINAEQSQIYVKAREGNPLNGNIKPACLYDTKGNKIGEFAWESSIYRGNTWFLSLDVDLATVYEISDQYVKKTGDEYKFLPIDRNYKCSLPLYTHELSVNNDLLDQIIEKDNLLCQFKIANREKDQCETEKGNLTKNNTELTSKVSGLTKEKDQCEAEKGNMAKITLKNIKAKIDEIDGIKTATDKITNIEIKVGKIDGIETKVGKIDGIETKVGKIDGIETKVGKIDGIKTKVDKMEAEIQALNVLIGKQDSQEHKNDTGIYKVIHENFTELMGGP